MDMLGISIAVLGVSLTLLFQGLKWREEKDPNNLGAMALTSGIILAGVGLLAIGWTGYKLWGCSSLFSLVAIGIGFGVYFAFRKKSRKK
jgi:hypothetical protein